MLRQHIIKFALLGLGIVLLPPLHAQEKLGIANSNFMPTAGIFLNPSSSADSKTYMQFNIVGLNAFAKTNLAYLPNFWFYGLVKNGIPPAQPAPPGGKLPRYLYAYGVVDGPAFTISRDQIGAGVFVRGRALTNMHASSALFNGLLTERKPGQEVRIDARNTRIASMAWVEYGGNFSYLVRHVRNHLLILGGSLRYITGIQLNYTNMRRLKGYSNDTITLLETAEGSMRNVDAAWAAGRGVGLDIGFTYKKMRDDVTYYHPNTTRGGCSPMDYKYKLGLTLRDIGFIRFKNASGAEVNTRDLFKAGYTGLNQAALAGLLETSMQSMPATAGLPTSLAGQFDWNFGSGIYLNVTAIKNVLPARLIGVQGPDLLSVCPRLEWWKFEAALPLTLQRYVYPQLGLALRYRSVVLGMDNMLPLVMRKNTWGLNLYLSVGVTIFKNPACRPVTRQVDLCPPKRKIPKRKTPKVKRNRR